MNNKFIIKCITYLFVFFSIFVFDTQIYAKSVTQQINVCTDEGYGFLVEYEGESKNIFYDSNGRDNALTSNLHGKANQSGSFEYGGTTYKYSYLGDYQVFGRGENTSRCFKTVDKTSNTTSSTTGSTTTETTKTSSYVNADWCGETRIAGMQSFEVRSIETINNVTGEQRIIFELSNSNPDENMLSKYWDYLRVTAINYKGTTSNNIVASKRINNGKYQIVVSGVIPPSSNEDPTLTIALVVDSNNNSQIFSDNITLKSGNYSFGTEAYALDKGEISLQALRNFCGNSLYIGTVSAIIPYASDVMVTNSYRNDPSCEKIKGFTLASENFKKTYVSECYDETITLESKLSGSITSSTIQEKYDRLESLFGNKEIRLTQLIDVDDLNCTNNYFGIPSSNDSQMIPFETKITYEETGTYWSMVCKEEYFIESDSPQLVAGGMGVHYNNKVEVVKTCSIINIRQVTKKPQCVVNVSSPNCHYDECTYCDQSMRDKTWTQPDTAGPNEDFDQCVSKCDGGSYTQSCLNKCYSEVYNLDRKLNANNNSLRIYSNKIDKANYKSSSGSSISGSCTFGVTGLNDTGCSSVGGVNVTVDCDSNVSCKGKASCCSVKVNGEIKQQVGVSNFCAGTTYSNLSGQYITANHGTGSVCDISYSVGPSGCSWNPESEYQQALSASRTELDRLQNLAQSESQISDYTIEITDSKSNVVYSVSGSTNNVIEDNPNLEIIYDEESSRNATNQKQNKQVTVQYGSQGNTVDYYKDYTKVTIYSVSLPLQYVSKNDYTDIVVKNYTQDSYYKFNEKNVDVINNSKYYLFNEYSEFNSSIYSPGENVYYTAFYGPEVNINTETNPNNIPKDLTNYERAFALYEINGKKYFKQLEFQIPNINVYFTIDTVGSENEEKANVKVSKFTENASYTCYYGVVNMISSPGSDPSDDGLRYYYREIYLEPNKNGYGGVFPNDRNPRWNWTGTISGDGSVSGAASNSDPSYLVNPQKLIEDIEAKGDSIFTNESEYDYVFTLSSQLINEIRRYNNSKIDGRNITYLDFSLVGTSNDKINYSQKIRDWYGDTLYHTARNITDCNNAISGNCDNS